MKNKYYTFFSLLLFSLLISGCSSSREPILLDSFKEATILSELPELEPYESIELKSLDMDHYNIISFKDDKLYLSFRKDHEFNIGYYDLDSNLLISLYSNENISISNTVYEIDNYIYLNCYSILESSENPYLCQVIQIDFQGGIRVLFERNCDGIGFFSAIDDKVLLKWGRQEKETYIDALTLIDPSSLVPLDIAESYYYHVDDDYITGERILYASGFNNIIYFQRITYKNELEYESGTTNIIKYNIKTNKTEKTFLIDTKSIYISGSNDFIVLSKYQEDNLTTETGYFYNLKEKTMNKIPTIFTNNFILKTLWISDSKVIIKPFGKYVYCDLKSSDYSELNISQNNEIAQIGDNLIMGLSFDRTHLNFYRFN